MTKPTLTQLKSTVTLAWKEEHREFQLFAIDFAQKHRKLFVPDLITAQSSLSYTRSIIINKGWWDTVDLIAANSKSFIDF